MKKKEVVKILEENKLTNITPMDFKEAADKEQKELDESMKESFRQRDERKAKEDNLKEMAKQWPEYTLEELKEEQALADYAEKFKIKDKVEPSVSEKMQEELEPLPFCPMADD